MEAALLALNKPAGLLRSNFGFMHLKTFDETLWKSIRKEARSQIQKKLDFPIVATDWDSKAVDAAKHNAATAGVEHLIHFDVCHFEKTPTYTEKGIVILNPEYGERLGQQKELETTYKAIGDFFKQKCQGYMGYIFTGNPHLGKKVGLRTKRKIEFYNAQILCRLLEYELYEGSR
jgi:putative N6-adenine-specific DNA methylase